MNHQEVEALRVYHETRCEQEQRRIRKARCGKSAVAHAHLFSLHRLMTIDLASPSELATIVQEAGSVDVPSLTD
jgi:hypothetical protein